MTLKNGLLDGLAVHAMLDGLLLLLTGINGTYESVASLLFFLSLAHVEEGLAGNFGDVSQLTSREVRTEVGICD